MWTSPLEKFIWSCNWGIQERLIGHRFAIDHLLCLISSQNIAPMSQKPSIVFHLVFHQRKYLSVPGSQIQVCLSQFIKKKFYSTAIISRCQFLRANLKSKKKMCTVTLHWYRHGYCFFVYQGGEKKDYFMCVPCIHPMGPIFLCQPVKPVEKQGPVIELESHADACSVLVRSGSVDWGFCNSRLQNCLCIWWSMPFQAGVSSWPSYSTCEVSGYNRTPG